MHSLCRRLRGLSRFPMLTHPSRLACARLQGGLNNSAPDGAGFTWLTLSRLRVLELLLFS